MSTSRWPRAVAGWWLLLTITLLAWWAAGLQRPLHPIDFAGLILTVPLIVGLIPVLRGSTRATAAGTLLMLPYLGWGLTEVLANPIARGFAIVSIFSSAGCFFALILWLRKLRSGSPG